jgi:vancomycin resistance protein YoaR
LLRKIIRFLSIVAIASLVVTLGIISFDFFQVQEKFPSTTLIGEADVSGLDQARAYERLSPLKASEVFTPLVTFEVEKSRFTFSPEAVGISLDLEKTIKQAFQLTHNGSYLKDLRDRLVKGPIRCPLVLKVNETTLGEILEGIAAEVNSTAKDASIILYEETGGYHIEAEELGREVKVSETIKEFKRRLAAGERTFPITVKYEYPAIMEKDLRAAPPAYRIAAFTTYYGRHDSPNRIHNIKLIASWLDGTLVMPDEEFSLADAIGEFTPERGFKEAFVIMNGQLEPQLGGGTCQIGTTFYNALQLADIKILQRTNHSFYFNIYPLGRDATVYPGQKDLKFVNDTGHPIQVKTVATNRRLSFRIYGTPTGKMVKFTYPAVFMLTEHGYIPATVRQVLDADQPFKTIVIRTVYDSTGKKIKEEKILSYYKLYGEKTNVPIARPEPR